MDISIVVPLYKGNKYISGIVEMVKRNVDELRSLRDVLVELVLINDYPDEKLDYIPDVSKTGFKVTVIETVINRGIHGARIEGLKYTSGEYILYLDQDDTLADRYLLSQWTKICGTEYDGIVCNVTTNLYDKFYDQYHYNEYNL